MYSLQDIHARLMELKGIVEELLKHEDYDSGSRKDSSLGPPFEVGSCLFRGPGVEGESGKAQSPEPKAQPSPKPTVKNFP